MSEKYESRLNNSEQQDLEAVYEELNDAGYFVKEFLWKKDKYGAAVGKLDDLAAALKLDNVDDITDEMIDDLPRFILFAAPGSGTSRVAAVRDAYATQLHIEQVEHGKQEERERNTMTARKALFSADEGEVRIVRGDSIVAGRWVPTDETIMKTYTVGGKTMSFERRVHEIRIESEIIEVSDTGCSAEGSTNRPSKHGISREEFMGFSYPGFQDWMQENQRAMLSADDLRQWAANIILSPEDYEQTIPCFNCKGAGVFENLSCWCEEANSITNVETGITAYDKDDKQPDSDCKRCGGSGVYSNACPLCDGAKEQYAYPALELYDPADGSYKKSTFDLAAMVRDYPEGLYYEYWTGGESQDGYGSATVVLFFDLAGYITKDVQNLDDSSRLYIKRTDTERIMDLHDVFRPARLQRINWRSQDGVKIPLKSQDIELAQESLTRSLSQKADGDRTRQYELYYAPTADVRLNDLRALASQFGWGICSSLQGYETGTRAYALYLIDDKNNFVAYLGQSYSGEDTIEQSWRALQKFIENGAVSDI